MLKTIGTIGAVLFPLAAAPAASAALPLLSGSYLYTSDQFCQLGVAVTYGSAGTSVNVVKSVVAGCGSNEVQVGGGVLRFTQSSKYGNGPARINGFQVRGSSVLLTETGNGVTGT